MTTEGHGPCIGEDDGWAFDPFCCDGIPAEDTRSEDEQALFDKLLRVATGVLWRASGRRYGLCPIRVRPCRPGCADSTYRGSGVGGPLWTPALIAGNWTNCRGCDSCGDCNCCNAGCSEIALPGPVHAVTGVFLGGTEVDDSLYRVDDHRMLVREDGACWPTCQDMRVADGEPGSFVVEYLLGIPVDTGGQFALSVYMCELWKLCTGQRCRLPLNTEGVFRQGINIDFADANLDLLSGMRTGIPEVDVWLAGVNPDRLRQPSQVYSVDAHRPRTATWPFA